MTKNNNYALLLMLPATLLLSTAVHAQSNVKGVQGASDFPFVEAEVELPKQSKSDGNQKALGTSIWSNTFNDMNEWILGRESNDFQEADWEVGPFPTAHLGYIGGAFNSTTLADGYVFFNAITHNPAIGGTAKAQNAWIQNATPIDLSSYDTIILSFYQQARKFRSPTTYLDYSTNNGVTWDSIAINFDVGTNTGTRNTWREVIPTNNTTQFLFRFRWNDLTVNGGGGYGWMIDDVDISTLADIDLEYRRGRIHVEAYRYTQIPLGQLSPFTVETYVVNRGKTDLTGVKLTLGGDATGESEAKAIPSGKYDTLIAHFTPAQNVGPFTLTRSFTMDQSPDDVPSNNDMADYSFEVTDSIYAVDAAPYSRLRWNTFADQTIEVLGIGASYDIFADQTLSAVDIKFDEGSLPEGTVTVELWKLDTSATTAQTRWGSGPLIVTDEWTLDTKPTNEFHTIPFPSPILLEANATYLILAIPADTAKIALCSAGSAPVGYNVQAWIRTSQSNEESWSSSRSYITMRMHFGKVLPCLIDQSPSSVCKNSTLTLASAQLPGGVWSSSDETIATVNPTTGVVKGLIADTTVTISYGGGTASCTTPATKVITINDCAPPPPPPPPGSGSGVGLNDIATISAVELFPNPANELVNVQFELLQTTDIVVELTDLSGRVVHAVAMNNGSAGTNNATLDLSTLDNGIYMVVLRSDNTKHVTKLIKN